MQQVKQAEHQDEQDIDDSIYSQFLTFWLADEIYGINISTIKEITEYGGITYVPTMPSFISGVMNLRGSVVPVINLAVRFGKPASPVTKKTSVVILEITNDAGSMEIGVVVDKVNEVLDICVEDIEPPPAFGAKIRTDFISGMGKVKEKLLVLVDVTNVLSVEELSVVTESYSESSSQPE